MAIDMAVTFYKMSKSEEGAHCFCPPISFSLDRLLGVVATNVEKDLPLGQSFLETCFLETRHE